MNDEAALAVIEILEAAAAAIRAVISSPEESPPAACDHPEDQRIDLSTMGVTRWQCKVCGHVEEVNA